MKPSFTSLCGGLIVAFLNLAPLSSHGEDASKASSMELAKKLFSEQMLPQIQVQGRFEFFSAYESETLEPSSSADFTGEINLASHATHFDFQNYRSPVSQSKEPALHASYAVTFDGEKWLVLDGGSRITGLPQGVVAVGEVTADHPALFLKSLDQLCFPLFASLLNVQVGFKQAPLKEILAGDVPEATMKAESQDALLVITIRNEGVSDELTFDTAKGYALVHRRTDFGHKLRPTDNQMVNELAVDDLIQAGELWFPKAASFTQTVNSKLMIRRNYDLKEVKIVPDAKPIVAVIPPHAYVRDELSGTTYRTDDAVLTLPVGK